VWVAVDGNAMTNGKRVPNNWFKNLEIEDTPQYSFNGLEPGQHSATVAHKTECGTWNMKGVEFTVPGEEEGELIEIEVSDDEIEDYLSTTANLSRYGRCMVGNLSIAGGAWSIVRRNGKNFITKWVTSPLRLAKQPVCLIQATGGLETPPDPDSGIMICYPQMGMYTQCPNGWETFFKSDDGTEALSRMGAGPAPHLPDRDNQARLSCMAVIYNKYNQYGRDLDAVFNDPDLIRQGCNKSRPGG